MEKVIYFNKTGGYVVEPEFMLEDLGFEDGITSGDVKGFFANVNETTRVNIVTQVAAITRGRDKSNNPIKRYKRLLAEAAPNPSVIYTRPELGDDAVITKYAKKSRNLLPYSKQEKLSIEVTEGLKASRVLEFVPVVFKIRFESNKVILYLRDSSLIFRIEDFNNKLGRFGFIHDNKFYTNLRAVYNTGNGYDSIPYNTPDETKYFKVFKIRAPHFVFDQIYTHTMLSKVAVSERVVDQDPGEFEYYLPDDIVERVKNKLHEDIKTFAKLSDNEKENLKEIIRVFTKFMSVDEVKEYLKCLGYKKEIYNRWSYGLKYKTWFMAGWIIDTAAWPHFLLEREAFPELHKSWVQKDTALVAKSIKDILTFLEN